MTINDLITLAGGEAKIANTISQHAPTKSTFEAIRHWYSRGIPQKYWVLLSTLTGVDVADIAAVSAAVEATR
jgi:hypothetical protein